MVKAHAIMHRTWTLLLSSMIGASAPVSAAETVTYSYDALGRLVTVTSAGTVNNGVVTTSAYDAAGNRTNYAVTGSATSDVVTIVVHLGGRFRIFSMPGE